MNQPIRFYDNVYLSCQLSQSGLIPGYTIVYLKGGATSMDQLNEAAQLSLIKTLANLQAAMRCTIKPERIYTLSIGELLPTLHFHLFPRTKDLLDDYRTKLSLPNDAPINGVQLFDWARIEYATTPFGDYDHFNQMLVSQFQSLSV